jgi:hypothetical protein
MVNGKSIFLGTLYGAGIAGVGLFLDNYLGSYVQGNVPYLNNVASGAGHLLGAAGLIAGGGVGIYEAFFSSDARNNPPNPPANPNIPNAGPRINIINRGGRNIFRF